MSHANASNLVSTGIRELDDRLGGGVPAGSVVAVLAPPDTAGELLAHAMATGPGRHTEYVSTGRPADRAEADLDRYRQRRARADAVGQPELTGETEPTEYTVTGVAPPAGEGDEAVIDAVEERLDRLRAGIDDDIDRTPVLVVDAVSAFGRRLPPASWRRLLERVAATVAELDGVAYLLSHAEPRGERTPAQDHLLHVADGVFAYERGGIDGQDVLAVSKLRRLPPTGEDLPFSLPLLIEDRIKRDPDETA